MKRFWTLLLLLLLAAPVSAQDTTPAEDEEEQENPFADFEELIEDAELTEGFFNTYQKEDKLYLSIPEDMLGNDFLMEYEIARGIGARGLFGGTMLGIFEMDLMALERHGEKVFLMKRPYAFHATGDERATAALDLTFGSSVVESAEIEATSPEGELILDVTGWFVSDLSGISQRVRSVASTTRGKPGSASFDASRSYLESVRGFPDNLNIRAKLTFKPGEPVGMPSVPDGRYIPVSIHYTMARLPERPMEIRYGDERVGNFWTVHKDFAQEDSTFFRRYVNRWRLERGERAGDKWRPVEPITYYIDPNVPDEYRGGFKAGVEAWNRAFEAAGWVDAIRALDLPEGADPEDIRYATLRWNVSDRPGYGAIGPSMVDPRTGEILDADILFEANMFAGLRNTWRNMVSPLTAAQAFEMALGVGEFEASETEVPGTELPGFAAAMEAQGVLAGAVLTARGEMGANDPLPEDFFNQFVKWVTMHEVGHSLGLQHNFRSSSSTPLDKLHDDEWAEENGVFSSVMEYPTVNLNARGSDNGYYYNPGVGSYDRWAISFSYTQDQERANEIAREVADKRHMFGNEARGPGALDPSINTYDLSDDPLAWGARRTELIRGLLEDLPEHILTDNTRYADLTSAYQALMNEYARGVAPAVKYIGGQYLNRDHPGDPDGRAPFVNVPESEQADALRLIVDRVFAADALTLDEEFLQQMGSNRWTHWGSTTSFNGRLDFPYHEQVLGLQNSMLGQLLHPWRLARIRDGEMKFGADEMVTIPELMLELTDAIWSELTDGGSISINAMRRDLQRAYIDQMTRLVVNPADRTPADARSVARMRLTELRSRITNVGDRAGDDYTQAHLAESTARIEKALEAGLEAEGS
ncbi:MAG: zinc-dependent metalloprotease [Gemmatimonadota bacterium]|nr:MAG: zinc-dependent metalloprotease [Gemmatimonadota bacterium]